MKTVKKDKTTLFLTGLLFAVSLFALVFFAIKINDAVAVNKQSAQKLARMENDLSKLNKNVAIKNERYYRLLHDEEFVKRIIKEKFGYTYPDEIVFKFKDGEISTDTPKLIE